MIQYRQLLNMPYKGGEGGEEVEVKSGRDTSRVSPVKLVVESVVM
jgi:hypothetical protein